MSVTLTKIDEDVWGKIRVAYFNVLLDSSYPTGGYGASLGLSAARIFGARTTILGAVCIAVNAAGSGIVSLIWDYANNKLMAFRSTGASHTHDLLLKNAAVADGATTRVNAGANLLGANTGGDLTVTGSGANGGIVAATAGAANLVQVSNGVSLSAVTARIRFEGR